MQPHGDFPTRDDRRTEQMRPSLGTSINDVTQIFHPYSPPYHEFTQPISTVCHTFCYPLLPLKRDVIYGLPPREVAAVVEEVKHSLLGQFAFVHVPKGEEREGGSWDLGGRTPKPRTNFDKTWRGSSGGVGTYRVVHRVR